MLDAEIKLKGHMAEKLGGRLLPLTPKYYFEEVCGLQSRVYANLFPPPHLVAFCTLFLFVKNSSTLVHSLLLQPY